MTPDPDAIRRQLERILASPGFAASAGLGRLLRAVVERTLAGEGDQLKEYVIATEVMDRPESYDPRLDSSVRVQARRLRARLDEFYAGPGAGDPVVISIPRGGYAPEFSLRGDAAADPAPGVHATAAAVPHPRRAAWAALAAAILAAAVFTAMRVLPGRDTAHAAAGPGIAVLPFASYSTSSAEQLLAERLTDAVVSELVKSGRVSVASRTSTAQYAGRPVSAATIAAALQVEFLMEASVYFDHPEARVIVRLVDPDVDRKVWAREYDSGALDQELASRIAIDATAAIAEYIRERSR